MAQPTLNPHVATLDTPAIPLALGWAQNYNEEYGPLIDLSQAVPNYPPHSDMLIALSSAAANFRSCGYGEIEGEISLRKAYAEHVSQRYQQTIDHRQIHITSGCNQAFFASLIAIAGQGNTVLMSNPCYFNHEATAKMLGITLCYFDCAPEDHFLPDLQTVAAAIDDSVKVLALVSPNNPTGAIYPPELIDSLFQLCQQKGIWLILDETYREFAPNTNTPHHTIFQHQNWEQNFIQLYSFSKTYCIPGHRLGAVTAGKKVISAIAKVMDNLQICAPRAAQLALADQMDTLDNWVSNNNETIANRAQVFKNILSSFPEWRIKSIGGYFAYVEHPFKDMDAAAVTQMMASQYGILPLPGSFFGANQQQHLRIAFANADATTLHLLEDRLKQLQTR